MDYSNIALFSGVKTKMMYLSERQDVLAQNIANVDTPGFKARDLKKLDFSRLMASISRKLAMRTTSPQHLSGTAFHAQFREEDQRKTYETTPVENSVVVEEQMMKVAQNNMEYQTVTNLYGKVAAMFKTAIGNKG